MPGRHGSAVVGAVASQQEGWGWNPGSALACPWASPARPYPGCALPPDSLGRLLRPSTSAGGGASGPPSLRMGGVVHGCRQLGQGPSLSCCPGEAQGAATG